MFLRNFHKIVFRKYSSIFLQLKNLTEKLFCKILFFVKLFINELFLKTFYKEKEVFTKF